MLRFGGVCVLLVAAGTAALLSLPGLPAIGILCAFGSVYYASVAVAYLLVRGRKPESLP